MIQRIQTLYLLIVAVLTGVMHFTPLAGVVGVGESLSLTIYGLKSSAASGFVMPFYYMGIIVTLACLLALVIIFLYKRRQLQIRLCFAEMVLLIGAQIFAVLYIVQLSQSVSGDAAMVYGISSVFPVVCAILTYLAMRGVIRDEAKVRSLDRIR